MRDLKTCNKCGHQNQPLARICPECGEPLTVNQSRAFALIEGTAGVGKSTLVNQLVQQHIQTHAALNTLLRLGQGHTYGPLRPDDVDSELTKDDTLAYLERIYDTLAFLSHPSGVPTKLVCIIETLHLTLAFRPGLLSEQETLDYDRRLAALGCKLMFIQISPQAHWERCIWERRKNGFITQYAAKYGRDLTEIHQYYVNEQAQMLKLFERSCMEKLLLDGEASPQAMFDAAYEFWTH